ncbi:uncharacterized protein METZ01_LOCUS187939, partial [marine metagenome]
VLGRSHRHRCPCRLGNLCGADAGRWRASHPEADAAPV